MRKRHYNNTHRRRRRGTAIIEFAMSIPLMATVLAAIFFFGWGMQSQQRVKIAGRYASWRRVKTGQWTPANESLDSILFDGRTSDHSIDGGNGPSESLTLVVSAAGDVSPDAGDLAQRTISDRWPRGQRAHVSAEFTPKLDSFRRLTGAIHDTHVRDGRVWRRHQASNLTAVRDQFLLEFDELMDSCPSPGDSLAGEIQRLYLGGW